MCSKRRLVSYLLLVLSLLVNPVGANVVHAVNDSQASLAPTQTQSCVHHSNNEPEHVDHHLKVTEKPTSAEHGCCDEIAKCTGACEPCFNLSLTLLLPFNPPITTGQPLSALTISLVDPYTSTSQLPPYRPPII